MTKMTASERRIEAHMARDRDRYGGDPYHYVEWTRKPGIKFYGWAKKEKYETLDWIPEMARAIQDEAYEYNMLFDAGVWKPGQEPTKVDEEGEFNIMLRRHKELATMRAELSRLDREAADEQRTLANLMGSTDRDRWYTLITATDATKRIYDYSDQL